MISVDNKDKVQIKLERHKWPDELAREKRTRQTIGIVIVSLIVSFIFGWHANNLILGNKSINSGNSSISRFERVYHDIVDNWFFANDMDNPEEGILNNAIQGMLDKNGDIHTSYMTKEESQDFSQSINMSFVGIGVQYFDGGDINVITNVFKNSPAEKAGLQAGDIIQKVDGVPVTKDNKIKDMVLGKAGTKVVLDILRNSESLTLTLTRAEVSALATGYMANKDTGYLQISSFGQQLGSITESYLKDFKAANAKNLIIDLRDNGGGLLEAVNDLSKLFLKNGDVVYKENYKNGKTDEYHVRGSVAENYPFDSVVVLINENSASASEVLTLALQQNINAKVVGRNSYGKGTVQVTYTYPDSSALKVTIAKWLGPDGNSINGTGIKPDYAVDLSDIFYADYVELNETDAIKFDSVHEAVSYVQKGLKYLGYHTGRVDGYYDSATKNALLKYSTENNLNLNGDITKKVIANVYSSVLRDWSLNKKNVDVQLHKALEVVYD